MSDPTPEPSNDPTPEPSDPTFSQADVDRIVAERLKREREATKAKYADYDDLKAKAEGAKTAEERIAALEGEVKQSKLTALRAQYADGVPEKLRPLLTGATEDELKAQRELLVEGEAERKKKNNVSPREGNNPQPGSDEMRDFTRKLFASTD